MQKQGVYCKQLLNPLTTKKRIGGTHGGMKRYDFDFSKLKGKITEKCGTNSVFAEKMGWSMKTNGLKLSGGTNWSADEILLACEILNIEKDMIPAYFFRLAC